MHFLITGGAGFIGSHIIETLIADHHTITVIDNISTGKLSNVQQSTATSHEAIKLIKQDLLTCQREHFPDSYDGLVHLAATPSVSESWERPLRTHNNNISTTLAALQLCHQLSIPRFVFASSAAVYGNPLQVPILETSLPQPISPYGLHKLTSEQYIALFSKQLSISSVSLRLFNVFGPRQRPDSAYSGVISIFAAAMKAGQPLTLNGQGTQTRDFVYVKDVAMAFEKALLLPLQKGASAVYNIGCGEAISLTKLVDVLKTCLPDWQAGYNFGPPRSGDIQHSQADISAARAQLAFVPQWTLKAGLEALIASLEGGKQKYELS